MSGLTAIGEVLAAGRYQRVPSEIRVAKVRGWLRSAVGINLPDEFAPILSRCESGAEARLLWEFCTRPNVRVVDDLVVGVPPLVVFPQYEWDRYRLDFYVEREDRALCVEVDGLGFHRVSADVTEADYSRDRRIVAGLCPVVRFTAREVFRDAARCWFDIEAVFQKRGA